MKFNIYRFALGFIFLVFGIWQAIQPIYWTSYLPLWTKNFNQEILMRINGIFNLFVGIGLILGFYPLIFSGLAILHLIVVIKVIGIFNDIAIRDIGLLILTISIFLEEVKKSAKIKLLIKRIFKKDF